jgi:hypothetical protein
MPAYCRAESLLKLHIYDLKLLYNFLTFNRLECLAGMFVEKESTLFVRHLKASEIIASTSASANFFFASK